ncbi:MAG: hypothetical protein NXI10_06210 [bacterium]|nr:hypothetical protein [bacterium]
MDNVLMKYLGKKDAFFLFERHGDSEIIRFHHIRSDLIHHYDLFSEKFINRLFLVKFFISNQDDQVSRIISDMEVQEELRRV